MARSEFRHRLFASDPVMRGTLGDPAGGEEVDPRLAWILLSADTYKDVFGLPPETAIVPFSQPGIVTIPLGFVTLIVVSLLTRRRDAAPAGVL